jgi:hypothetical protein
MTVLTALGGSTTVRFAALSGSLAAGLGHSASDVDIHVVLRNRGADPPPRVRKIDGRRVQLTFINADLIGRAASMTESLVAAPAARGPYGWSQSELWNVFRLVCSRILLADGDLRAQFDNISRTNLRQIMMGVFSQQAARAAEDTAGMLRENANSLIAYDTAAQGLRAACEVSLVAIGDFYAQPKFLTARLSRSIVHQDVWPRLWGIFQMPGDPFARRVWKQGALDAIFWAQHLVASSLLEGWDQPLKLIPVTQRHSDGPLRSPGFGLIRYPESWSLAGGERSYKVNEGFARVWLSLDGKAESTAPRREVDRLVSLGMAEGVPTEGEGGAGTWTT